MTTPKTTKPALDAAAADTDCGCESFRTSRRGFMGGVAALAGAGVITAVNGSVFTQASMAATGTSTGTVVVVSLRGGADGMSIVVPHGDPGYYAARKTIGVPKDALLQRDDMFGLHPMFKPLEQMWIDKKFAAVHAVGLPQPNRSHFSAMEVIEDADAGSPERSGWLNRLIGLNAASSPFEGVNMGSAFLPTSLFGTEPTLAVGTLGDLMLAGPDGEQAHQRRVDSLKAGWAGDRGTLADGFRSALEVSDVYRGLPPQGGPQHGAVYPTGDLGVALAQVANLLRADIGAEVVTVDSGSWDLHAGIGTLDVGLMKLRISDLATCLAAFFVDLGELASTTTIVTISEFGRRLQENAANGLDHGYGNCMLLLGAGVNGGTYYSQWPGLDASDLNEGDLAVTRDYRSVLAEVVKARFNPDLSKVFPNFTPETIGAMRAA